MSLRIEQDHGRFRRIVRGRIRQNLKRYISQGEIVARQGKETVSVPIPRIDIPRFRFADKSQGGVGQGEGEPGDPVPGAPEQGEGSGAGQAGQQPGEHALEVDVPLEELADILGEALQLPRIEPKGASGIEEKKDRYSGIRPVGPNSLRHFKRTFKNALKRQIATGTYDPDRPVIVPSRDDMRFRAWKRTPEPVARAVILYMMDVSGSMGEEQKQIVRIESFWIDTWLQRHYPGLETRFIVHDASAREVDRHTFFHTRESGGTMISSAYKLAAEILERDYPQEEWNVYLFHFSDGDNWSVDDTLLCVDLMRGRLLPRANLFGYGQVDSPYGSGQFIKDLRERFPEEEKVVLSEIAGREAIVDSIKEFLGTGR